MTNLPKLNWRIAATPSIPSSTAATNVIATLKSQLQSCQYWTLVETPNTGTTSLLFRPNATYSTSSNCNVVLAYNITGSTAYRAPDDAAAAATYQYRLAVGLTPDITENGSGSFRGQNADRPFQTATGNPRWSGYWFCANTGSISASFVLESEDNIFVGFKDRSTSSGTFGFLAGAVVESHDGLSGENNFRIYGIVTSGPVVISTTFWSSLTTFFGHNNTNSTSHAGVFIVSGGVAYGDATSGLSTNVWQYMFKDGTQTVAYDDYSTWKATPAGSRQVVYPVSAYGAGATGAAPARALGIYRGVFHTSDEAGGIVRFQSGGIDQIFKVSATHNNTNNDAFALGPASGSGL